MQQNRCSTTPTNVFTPTLGDSVGSSTGETIGSSSKRLLEASEAAIRDMNPAAHAKRQNMNLAANLGVGLTGDANYQSTQTPFTMIMENPALDALDDDSESDNENSGDTRQKQQSPQVTQGNTSEGSGGLRPGKKTKGRVKIKMEFIENKLRRYTTFSKRKTGIMKKAYELSTLTGTQVMLLVASETGHVYTFATRKLQPMITSESGKNLIQTCLNSPENGSPIISHNSLDQRMNPTGFEEMELSYAVSEEEVKSAIGENKFLYTTNAVFDSTVPDNLQKNNFYATPSQPAFPTPTTYVPVTTETNNNIDSTDHVSESNKTISVQLPAATVATVLQTATPSQVAGTYPQTIYRLSAPPAAPIISIPGSAAATLQQAANSVVSEVVQTTSVVSTSTSHATQFASANLNNQPLVTPSIVMYQTPQGLIYATPTSATLPGGSIFNFQQPAQPLSQPETAHSLQTGTQYITIPVPVSLAGSSQLLQLAGNIDAGVTFDYSQPQAAKKLKK